VRGGGPASGSPREPEGFAPHDQKSARQRFGKRLNDPSWWTRRRGILAALCAVAVAVVAFVYRFNSLDGSLGGFTNDQFAHLMRAEMLLHGEQPLRDFADAELRGAWPALSYALPAWSQQLFGRTLLAEAYLTVGAIALAHALVFLLALDLAKRWSVALLATGLAIAMEPRLYGYPKVLMLALGAVAIRSMTLNPSAWRLGLAAVTTAVATLFRHDCGVYVAVGFIAALIARDAPAWPVVGRRIGLYAGLTALCLLPSAVWVQVYEGIPSYVRNTLATAALEAGRTELQLPSLASLASLNGEGLVVLTYYAFWAVMGVAAAVIAWRALALPASPLTPEDRGFAWGLLAMAVVSNVFLLRDGLNGRFGDAVIPVAVLAAWCTGAARAITQPSARRLATLLPLFLLLFMFAASLVFGRVERTLADSGLIDSPQTVARQFASIREGLLRLPPVDWSDVDAKGTLVAARYVAECTSPDDYLLVAAELPEIPVFARRRFAAGQGTVALGFYNSPKDQRRALARLASQSVPIILANAGRFEPDFVYTYPLLARHVADHYREAGTIVAGDLQLLVFVENGRTPRRVDPHLGLPCFQ